MSGVDGHLAWEGPGRRLSLPPEDPIEFTPGIVDIAQAPPEVHESLAWNWNDVRCHYKESRMQNIYRFRLSHPASEVEVADLTIRALVRQKLQCRWNISFCLIIEKIYQEPREFTVFYASHDAGLFERMEWLATTDDFTSARDLILSQSLWEEVSKRLPSTKWKVHSILGMTVYAIKIPGHPLL